MVDTTVRRSRCVHHGGDMVGFHSDMMWLPAQGVGAVVLTNGDPGWIVRDQFRRKLLEVLFDGRPEADGRGRRAGQDLLRPARGRPQAAHRAGRCAGGGASWPRTITNDALGDIAVTRERGATVFDFGEWRSEVASRRNPDGTVSFLTIAPGVGGFEFVVGGGDARR